MTEQTGLAGGGPALFRLVRDWSRRWAADAARAGAAQAGAGRAGAARAGAGGPDQVGHVLALEAIDAALAAGSGAIGEVARQLGGPMPAGC
jgi:hypothetical protein